MRFVLAPDSFKESLTAVEAAVAMKRGIEKALPYAETHLCPVADGGEGTLDVLVHALGGTVFTEEVKGPLGKRIEARFAVLGDGVTAVVESAEASGLGLVPRGERDALRATSWGTGELIRRALDRGARKLIVGIGGSATSDAGAGALQALGATLLDGTGRAILPGGAGVGALETLDLTTLDPRLRKAEIDVACDVSSPLTGPEGASALFSPQKGATPEMVVVLERNLRRFGEALRQKTGKDVSRVPGSGAAGGLGAALLALGGRLLPGIELVLEKIGFDRGLLDADFVFTGEGRLDRQTLDGKAIDGVLRHARRFSVPVVAFAGAVAPGFEALYDRGLVSAFPITPGPLSALDALELASRHLERATTEAARLLATRKAVAARVRRSGTEEAH